MNLKLLDNRVYTGVAVWVVLFVKDVFFLRVLPCFELVLSTSEAVGCPTS